MIKQYEVKDIDSALNDVDKIDVNIHKTLSIFISQASNKEKAIDYAHEISEGVSQLCDIIFYLEERLSSTEKDLDKLVNKVSNNVSNKVEHKNEVKIISGEELDKKLDDIWKKTRGVK